MNMEYCRCPICNHQITRDVYTCPFGIEEEHEECHVCGYIYDYEYGGYRKIVGNKIFIWGDSLTENEFAHLMKKISKETFMARRNWKKFRKKTNAKICIY